MLTDRIKKFGRGAVGGSAPGAEPVPEESPAQSEGAEKTAVAEAPPDRASDKAAEDPISEIYKGMSAALSKVVAEKSDAVDSFVEIRLAQVDMKEKKKNAAEKDNDEKDNAAELPLLLKFSSDAGTDATQSVFPTDESEPEEKSSPPQRTYTFSSGRSEDAAMQPEAPADAAESKKSRSAILSKCCIFVPVLIAAIEVLLIIASRLSISSLERRDNIYLSLVVIQIVVYLIPGIFYCKLRHGNDISTLRLVGAGPEKIYFSVITAFLLLFISISAKLLLMKLGIYESRFAEYASYINISTFSSVSDIIYMSVTFVLIPAISEEFIFRSIVFGEFISEGFGYLPTVVISSLLYAMIHFSLVRLPLYFVIGIILAYVSIITGSVLITMISATLFGLLDVFTESYVTDLVKSDYGILLVFAAVSLLLFFLTLFFAEAERLFYNKGTSGAEPPVIRKRKEPPALLILSSVSSPTFIAGAAIFVLGVILSRI